MKSRLLLTAASLTLAGSLTARPDAEAGRVRQWRDPVTGETTFGDRPLHADAKEIRVTASKGLTVFCDDYCRSQADEIDRKRLIEQFMGAPQCRQYGRWHKGDKLGEQLARAAVEQCAQEKAARAVGVPTSASTGDHEVLAQWAANFDQQQSIRQGAAARAVMAHASIRNRRADERQEWGQRLTRLAIDDNTAAVRDLNRSVQQRSSSFYSPWLGRVYR